MPGESLPERITRVAGRAALEGLVAFDPDNALHVDQAARHLLQKLQREDDPEAWRLLVDLTADKLSQLARAVAREVGLVMDSDDLVAAYLSRLLVDLRRPRDEVRHFLKRAEGELRDEAEAWVRDFACMEIGASDGAGGGVSDGRTASPGALSDEGYGRIVRICYHRLETSLRRLLRAADVEQMGVDEIARIFSLPADEVTRQLEQARTRLAEAIEQAVEGGAS